MSGSSNSSGTEVRGLGNEIADASRYQITAAGMVLPFHLHVVFNAMAALSAFLLGHWVIAVAGFLLCCLTDALFQMQLARSQHDSVDSDTGRVFTKLAIICGIRNTILMLPAVAMALTRAGPEIAYMGIISAIGTLLAFTHGSLSRKIFWAHATPPLVASVLITLVVYPFVEASALLIGFGTLVVLLILTSNGATRAIMSWQAAFRANSELIADLRIARDHAVAERIAADAAREDAKQANHTKSNFLANMSHELRTPLNAVIGFSEMLGTEGFAAKRVEYSTLIHQSGLHLLALVDDILDLSKMEVGQVVLHEMEIDFRQLAENCVDLVRARALAGRVELVVQITGQPEIWVDERAIRQILLNLLSNAVKFTRPGGQVTLFAGVEPDGLFVFGVRDTGIGIAEADLGRAFESFGQGRHDAVTHEKGTGLGLPIVRGLVTAHGGLIKLQSVVGEGTTVTVALPAARTLDAQVRAQTG